MGHYIANERDLAFTLFDVFGLGQVLDADAWEGFDEDSARELLSEVRRLAEGPLGDSFASSDRDPGHFDPATHTVHLPEEFKASARLLHDAEWWRLVVPAELGGIPVPSMVRWAAGEMLIGANPAVFMLESGAASAAVLYKNGTEQQRKWAEWGIERNWGSTMALTEPEAGSDVGAGRANAREQADGSWHLEGTKRFITSADSDDLYENTFHLVLARPEGAGVGTKGLSLFYVPKFLFDPATGQLGERNGVFVTNVEHKMGLKASATCELVFGGHGVPARGWLVGEVHDGIAQMFDVIENARMVVGTKAIATLSTGYLNALAYAKTRVQGSDLTRASDKSAPRVTILHHPEVRRSLMMQKAYAEGLRAVYLLAAAHQDDAVAALVTGADSALRRRINDLLLPVVKGVGSERAFQYLTEALQIFGGSGYLQDFPLEQYLRDAKIDSLYEGTTAIQAQDFLFRKIIRDNGAAFGHLMAEVRRFASAPSPELAAERALLAQACDDVDAITRTLSAAVAASASDPATVYKAGLGSVRLLMAFGDLLIGWLLLRQAETALALGTEEDEFLQGKVQVARFFARNVLPEIAAVRGILDDIDLEIMALPEGGW